MKRPHCRTALLVSLLPLLLGSARSQTNTFIVPKEAESALGPSAVDPFFSTVSAEQAYAATEFGSLPSDVIAITEIAFRVDEALARPLDATFKDLILHMNVFTGSMQEIVARGSGLQNPISTVYYQTNAHLTGRPGQVDGFDVRFPLRVPFLFDRRRGQLVLEINAGVQIDGKAMVHMDAIGDPVGGFDREAYISMQATAGPLPSSLLKY